MKPRFVYNKGVNTGKVVVEIKWKFALKWKKIGSVNTKAIVLVLQNALHLSTE